MPDPIEELDDDTAPVLITPRTRQEMLLADDSRVEIEISHPRAPAPVHADTALNNHIDDDLALINVTLKNLGKGWRAVKTIQDMVSLSREIGQTLERRRRLANKQLGHSEGVGGKKDSIWSVVE